jgi:hypothetical protein
VAVALVVQVLAAAAEPVNFGRRPDSAQRLAVNMKLLLALVAIHVLELLEPPEVIALFIT